MISYFENIRKKAKTLTPERFKELVSSQNIIDTFNRLQTLEGDERADLKKTLPAVTWQAHFAEGSARSNDGAVANGLFIMDYDHEEHPFELWNTVLQKIKGTRWEGSIMAAHRTPSGKGLRLVVKAQQGLQSISANQKELGGIIGKEYDEAVKDLARVSFLVPISEFYYFDNNIFDYEEKSITRPSDAGSSAGHGDASQKKEEEGGASAEPVNEGEREALLDTRFRGTSYRTIVDTLVQKTGGVPAEGERNVRLYALARKLRYIVDFDAHKLFLILPTFGLSNAEVQAVAESAIKGGRTGKIPYDLWKIVEMLNASGEEDIEEVAAKEVALPPLPPVFKEYVGCAPASFKIPVIMSLLPIIGTLVSKLRATYLDGQEHSPSFMTVVEAPQASGKSFTRRLVNDCLRSIKMKDQQAAIVEHEYNQMLKKSKNAKEQPEEPHTIIRCIPASVSIAKLLKRLDAADGLHLFSFCEEIDTLTKSNSSGAWAQKSDIYRNAFDNAFYGQDYMSENSYSATVRVFYNLLLCGTPHAVSRFFKDPEDGLISRIVFTQLEDQFGAKMPTWKKLTAKQMQRITSICENLEERYNMTLEGDVRKECSISLKGVNKTLAKWLEKKRKEALMNDDHALDTFRRRAAVTGFRAAMLSYVLSDTAKQKDAEKDAGKFATFVADYMLHTLIAKYGEDLNKLTSVHGLSCQRSIYELAPDEFTTDEIAAILATAKRTSPARNVICRWKANGFVEKIGKNKFRKILK